MSKSKRESLDKKIQEQIEGVEENIKLYESTLDKFFGNKGVLKEEDEFGEDEESDVEMGSEEGEGEGDLDSIESDEEMMEGEEGEPEEEVELSDDQMEELADMIADKVVSQMDGDEEEGEGLEFDEDSEEGDEDEDLEEEGEDEEEDEEEEDDELEESIAINNFFDQDETLSEDFKTKAKFLFKKVVSEQVKASLKAEKTKLQKAYEQKLVKDVESIKEDIISKVDDYVSYSSEQWLKENKLAVENGTKVEIAEQFMSSMKTLFVENYIDIPQEKENVVSQLEESVTGLKGDLAKTLQSLKEMREENTELRKANLIEEACGELTLPQREKMRKILSDEQLVEEKDFVKKITILKESYFNNKKKPVIKDFEEKVNIVNEEKLYDEYESMNESMKSYTQILDQQIKN